MSMGDFSCQKSRVKIAEKFSNEQEITSKEKKLLEFRGGF